MNTNTGAIYQLPAELVDGIPEGSFNGVFVDRISSINSEIQSLGEKSAFAAYKDEIAAAARDIEAGDPIVPVSGPVAQKMKIGQREFRRRQNRRKKARRS